MIAPASAPLDVRLRFASLDNVQGHSPSEGELSAGRSGSVGKPKRSSFFSRRNETQVQALQASRLPPISAINFW